MFLFSRSSSSTAAGKKPEHHPSFDRPLSRHQTVTPSSMASSSDGMSMSDHRRARSEHRKRVSVFSGRSRSKTDNGTSSYHSNNSIHSTEPFSQRTSQDGISLAESAASRSGAPPDPSSKWVFPRANKRIRHQHSKSSLHSMQSINTEGSNDAVLVPRLHVDKIQQTGRPRASTYSLACRFNLLR
jgi:hypothetical protein